MNDREVARIVRPENKLKKKIGDDVSIKELLRPEIVEEAQKVIHDRKDEFLSWARSDMAMMEEIYLQLLEHGADHDPVIYIMQKAETLRDRSGMFGFQLASQIAKSLAKYCHDIKESDKNMTLVIRKHMDGLQTVFRENIEGMGGLIGVELMDSLKKLIGKYHSEW